MDIFEMYRLDPGVAYELTYDELVQLQGKFGEMEPIIDAMMRLSGASRAARAEQLGCSVDDFWYEDY
jgi:hypothetical protein